MAVSLPSTSVSFTGVRVTLLAVVPFPEVAANVNWLPPPSAPKLASAASVPASAAAARVTVRPFSSVAPPAVVNVTPIP